MSNLNWTDDGITADGINARGFAVARNDVTVPGVLWQPAAPAGPRPLVLMGHGGNGHKRNARMAMLGQLFAGRYGWCAAAIDGPVHGDRGPVVDSSHPAYREMWQRPNVVEDMIGDWRATLDALGGLEAVDSKRVGYWGRIHGHHVRGCRLSLAKTACAPPCWARPA